MLSILLILAECYGESDAGWSYNTVRTVGRLQYPLCKSVYADVTEACPSACRHKQTLRELESCIKLPGPLCEMVRHPAAPLNHRSALA
ncbi:hypothetical protein T06_3391 [Trichinella sp. T6]|nr:hypothetical protein T06_3391 [Trichinella sp. T6]